MQGPTLFVPAPEACDAGDVAPSTQAASVAGVIEAAGPPDPSQHNKHILKKPMDTPPAVEFESTRDTLHRNNHNHGVLGYFSMVLEALVIALVITAACMKAGDVETWIVPLLVDFLVYFGVVVLVCEDPTGTRNLLRSLRGRGATVEEAVEKINQYRNSTLQVALDGKSSHIIPQMEGREPEHVKYANTWYFKYDRCRDLSIVGDALNKIDENFVGTLEVSPQLHFAQGPTQQALESCTKSIRDYIRQHHNDNQISCNVRPVLSAGGHLVIFMNPKQKHLWCASLLFYNTMGLLCLGTLCRFLLYRHIGSLKLHLYREVHISETEIDVADA